jgi:hypothetical protein
LFGFLFTHFLCHRIFFIYFLFPLLKIPIQKARSFVFSNVDGQDISCRSMMIGASRFMGGPIFVFLSRQNTLKMELVACSIRVMICLFSASLVYGPCHWSSLISGYAKRITTLASETNICLLYPFAMFLRLAVLEGVCVFWDRSGKNMGMARRNQR